MKPLKQGRGIHEPVVHNFPTKQTQKSQMWGRSELNDERYSLPN